MKVKRTTARRLDHTISIETQGLTICGSALFHFDFACSSLALHFQAFTEFETGSGFLNDNLWGVWQLLVRFLVKDESGFSTNVKFSYCSS